MHINKKKGNDKKEEGRKGKKSEGKTRPEPEAAWGEM
jgi:hypothetical protein